MRALTYSVVFVIFCIKGLSSSSPGYPGQNDDQGYLSGSSPGYPGQNDDQGYLDNPDDYEEIVRPCAVYDLNCIRKFFAEHSKCEIRNGPIPDSLTVPETIFLGRINTSIISEDKITGLNNTKVEEFYYNKATNKIVFAIEMRNYARDAPNTYIVVYRRGREPVVAVGPSTFQLDSLVATSVIPFKDEIKLEEAEVTAYFDNPVPNFSFGPELLLNPDPAITSAFAAQLSDVRTDTQEDFLTTILPLPIFYIQTNICDFGLKLPATA